MKTITTSCLGYDVPVSNVPETLEEATTVFGGEQKLLDAAVNFVRLHKTNTEVRDTLVERIAAVTGIERKTKTVASPTKSDPTRQVEEFDESEQEYAKRAHAVAGKTAAELALEVFAITDEKTGEVTSLSVKFDPTSTRVPGAPKTSAKVYIEAATKILANTEKLDANVALLESSNPGVKIARDSAGVPTIESLASALKVNLDRATNEAKRQMEAAAQAANAALGLV